MTGASPANGSAGSVVDRVVQIRVLYFGLEPNVPHTGRSASGRSSCRSAECALEEADDPPLVLGRLCRQSPRVTAIRPPEALRLAGRLEVGTVQLLPPGSVFCL